MIRAIPDGVPTLKNHIHTLVCQAGKKYVMCGGTVKHISKVSSAQTKLISRKSYAAWQMTKAIALRKQSATGTRGSLPLVTIHSNDPEERPTDVNHLL